MAKDAGKHKFRMHIEYPDGTVHKGKKDFKSWTDFLGISNFDFSKKHVLDVATNEGWWAFWAEMQGAEYVEASDVELGEDYDWGAKKDWEWINSQNEIGAELKNISEDYSLLAIQGPKAVQAMQSLTSIDLSAIKFYHFQIADFAGIENIIISATGYTGSGGIEI